jgi:hypothetical protein
MWTGTSTACLSHTGVVKMEIADGNVEARVRFPSRPLRRLLMEDQKCVKVLLVVLVVQYVVILVFYFALLSLRRENEDLKQRLKDAAETYIREYEGVEK